MGCLFWLGFAAVWALVAWGPLLVAGDLTGPVVGAHWVVMPAQGSPASTGPGEWAGRQVRVRVPVGSRLRLTVDEVSSTGLAPGFQPSVQCYHRDGAGPWLAGPSVRVPVLAPVLRRETGFWHPQLAEPTLSRVALQTFPAAGSVSMVCLGSQPVDVWRDDAAVQHRFGLMVTAAKVLWPVLVTALFWGPVVLLRRRRR